MNRIGLFYGTNTGFTEIVVKLIEEEFRNVAPDLLVIHDIANTPATDMLAYNQLIVGCPTWNIGELQDDWDKVYDQLDDLDFSGKQIAIFGLGDQYGYPDSFGDAIGILAEKFATQGAQIIGLTSADGYDFDYSRGVKDGQFLGLALDEDNESDLSPQRVTNWVWQLVDEFDLVELLEPAL